MAPRALALPAAATVQQRQKGVVCFAAVRPGGGKDVGLCMIEQSRPDGVRKRIKWDRRRLETAKTSDRAAGGSAGHQSSGAQAAELDGVGWAREPRRSSWCYSCLVSTSDGRLASKRWQ